MNTSWDRLTTYMASGVRLVRPAVPRRRPIRQHRRPYASRAAAQLLAALWLISKVAFVGGSVLWITLLLDQHTGSCSWPATAERPYAPPSMGF